MNEPWWIALIEALVVVNIVLGLFAYLTLIERKVMGRMQLRYGPNRAGKFGLLQPIADLLKLIRKEAFAPSSAIELPYILAPIVSAFTAIAAFAFIPYGPGWTVNGWHINGEIANVSIGLIAIFALGSIGIYGFIVGGWASESKFSILGSMRTCAQLVSYEVSLALSVLGVVILGRSLNLPEIVSRQGEFLPYAIPQFVGLIVFFFAGIAETSRAPFDLPEAEQELVAGYHTEYSGMRWGLFQMAEYINLITISGLMVTLFFEGWHGPWDIGPIWFLLKTMAVLFVFIWLRTTLPRLRYDQLMRFGWKVLLPMATVNAVVTAALVVGFGVMSPQPLETFKGFGVTFKQIFKKPITQQYPEYKRPVYPRFRGRHRLHLVRERAGEVRRLLALRGRVPGGLHPGRRRREHAGQPRLGRRALRADLRDQPQPLHLLRLLRARVPVRRDHARQRVRDLGAQPRRPDLHEGHAAHAAGEADAGRGRGPLRHADSLLQERLVIVASAGNVLVWIVWFVAAFACVGSAVAVISFSNPFFSALALIGNLGSLAVMYLLLSAEFVAAAQVLVYAGAVVVMFLFVIAYVGPRKETPWSGGPSWQTFCAVAAAGALLVEIVVAVGMQASGSLSHESNVGADFGTPGWIGRVFLVDHLLAFEITSVVLLIAAVGGVILGSHTRRAT